MADYKCNFINTNIKYKNHQNYEQKSSDFSNRWI